MYGLPYTVVISFIAACVVARLTQALHSQDRPLSTRRLKKEILRADSENAESANAAGHITLTDGSGTPRSVRVVQSQEVVAPLYVSSP
jgi:hypothetical protein